ncbi:acyl carrier protein [Tritonibacter multivorans]|uniref:acyl carrier protein n=1 Tax=Tritonibacter multivorans TaxID=928856 RepID=UPI0013F4CC18|nr:phosphopantetheine-binding protein [Tritonibacter multivorans]MDA7422045.1 phosphopantetheine-binding protein [Tritonibacter multivorans]
MTTSLAETAVYEILTEFAEEWGLDDLELTGSTTLKCDMGFESTDIMQLFLGLQEAFPSVKIPFQNLIMTDGKFVEDVTVQEVIAFVNREIAGSFSPA